MLNQLTKDSYTNLSLDNIFCVFESIDNIIHLIYLNNAKSIISFNLINPFHNFFIYNLYKDKG